MSGERTACSLCGRASHSAVFCVLCLTFEKRRHRLRAVHRLLGMHCYGAPLRYMTTDRHPRSTTLADMVCWLGGSSLACMVIIHTCRQTHLHGEALGAPRAATSGTTRRIGASGCQARRVRRISVAHMGLLYGSKHILVTISELLAGSGITQ